MSGYENARQSDQTEAGLLKLAQELGTYPRRARCSGIHGTNENTNGLLRQYFPKGSDFDEYSEKTLGMP
jgi:IS30 family transposase